VYYKIRHDTVTVLHNTLIDWRYIPALLLYHTQQKVKLNEK